MALARATPWLFAGVLALPLADSARTEGASEPTTRVSARTDDAAPAPSVDFNRQIRPILSESCYQCHGPDQNKRKADLRLDLREGLFRSADGITIVVPGKPDESELVERIATDDPELRMPPAKSGSRLTAEQVGLITALGRRRGPVEGALGLSSTNHGRQHPKQRLIDRPRATSTDSSAPDWPLPGSSRRRGPTTGH